MHEHEFDEQPGEPPTPEAVFARIESELGQLRDWLVAGITTGAELHTHLDRVDTVIADIATLKTTLLTAA